MVAASTAGFSARAQEQAPNPAQTELPPLEVTTQKAEPKKAKAKKKAASSTAVSPAPQGPAAEAAAAPQTPSEQLGLTPPSGNTNQSGTGLGRLPGTLQDMPQTVNVVPQKIIQEQKISTIDQALRAVPGVTVAIGEGGGGLNGDQFRIRGLQAKGDIYVDGLRDFGVYVRDAFATEQVEVFKGPSSESFGQGTGGGVINLSQKTAHLGDAGSVEVTVGNGPYARTVIDINKQINATTAARAVAMYHDQDLVDRDHNFSNRWGFLGSVAFGLGTDTSLSVNYLHQEGDRTPDYGVPILARSGTATKANPGTPVTEWLVPKSTYYGKSVDHDETQTDILTARFKSKLNQEVSVFSDTRLAFYSRDFASGPAECGTTVVAGYACATQFASGDYEHATLNYGGGNPGYEQDTWGAQNITGVNANFNAGGFKHEAVAGVDVYYQSNERRTWFVNGTKQPGTFGSDVATIVNPVYENVTGYTLYHDDSLNNGRRESDATSFAVFASDRLWLTKEVSLLGGIRWDHYEADFGYQCVTGGTTTCTGGDGWKELSSTTEFWSPKLSVIWEPTANQNYYVSWARAFSPTGGFISNEVNSIGTAAGQSALDPEVSETWEAGVKYTLLGGRLGLTAAAFHIMKDNARYTDSGGDSIPSSEIQRVQGIELGISGQLTKAWSMQAAYAYLDSEILSNGPPNRNGVVTQTVGNRVQQTPENTFSLWTTYDLSTAFYTGPGKLLVGGGVTYADGYFTNSANTYWIPHQLTFDGLVSYEIDSWRLALNGLNLTDELYYVESQNNRATVAPGRTVLFTVAKTF